MPANAQQSIQFTFPEQRSIRVRDPSQLPTAPVPKVAPPNTVRTPGDQLVTREMSLDEAIQIALQNADVIRILTGVSASSSGRTLYDVAISNTDIDIQNSFFDPNLDINATWAQLDTAGANFVDPFNPLLGSNISGSTSETAVTSIGLSKRLLNGGDIGLTINPTESFFKSTILPLNPEYRSSVEMTLRQPLMRGFGRAANLVPIVVARIDTERSYFQFKDSVQELVRGVIAAYWQLVAARVDVWAREQQVQQAQFAFDRATARQEEGLGAAADVAQARSALANFRASLIRSRSNQILSETALRNILGLEPSDTTQIVPTSQPITERLNFNWELMLQLAEQQRPDIIELKLILEADEQLLLQADNQARPQLDGIASYRWDGLEGVMPNGVFLPAQGGPFTGWTLGANFSVPLGLRQSRASLRRQELIIARDRVNLQQGIHQMVHDLTITYRNLDQFYEEIIATREAREAARINYENQVEEVSAGRREFLNALQAITDWGNAVSLEASSVTQYNTELANMERETGTILESHGIVFAEERFCSIGPLGRLAAGRLYPSQTRPDGRIERYPDSGQASDATFDLQDLNTILRRGNDEEDESQPPNNGDSDQLRSKATPEYYDLRPQPHVRSLPRGSEVGGFLKALQR